MRRGRYEPWRVHRLRACLRQLGAFSNRCLGGFELTFPRRQIYSCLDTLNETTAVWSQASCVAAATCDGTRNLLALAQCENSAISADVTDDSFLNYNVSETAGLAPF